MGRLAPVIALNNSADENYESRIFSLFHELAHLCRRDVAACGRFDPENDADEHWCDRFAAAALLPEVAVRSFVASTEAKDELALASKVARHFNASLSATALRLADLQLADQSVISDVFAVINSRPRRKRTGGGGSTTRVENRRRQLGTPLLGVFLSERRKGRMNDLDLADFLRVERTEVDDLAASLGGTVS